MLSILSSNTRDLDLANRIGLRVLQTLQIKRNIDKVSFYYKKWFCLCNNYFDLTIATILEALVES